jgi:hypothetical protein
MLIVKDNFFKEDLVKVIAKGTELFQWSYHHKSDVNDPTHNNFFVSRLWTDSMEDNFFTMLWTMIQRAMPCLNQYYCWRIIANGQVKEQDGNWHTDHGDKTVLYFPLQWDPEWGGSTYFNIDGCKTSTEYKQNRLVIFDSEIFHYGSCPSTANILRISLAFNLRTIQNQ